MLKFGVLGALGWIAVALANPIQAAPLTPGDLNANTDAVVQIEEVSGGLWEISAIANAALSGITVGILEKANVTPDLSQGDCKFFGAAVPCPFVDLAEGPFSFTENATLASFVFSASGGFAANTAHRLALFFYANAMPMLDLTGITDAFGEPLLKQAGGGIDLARVELRGGQVIPEPSVLFLLGAGLAGLAFLRRRSA